MRRLTHTYLFLINLKSGKTNYNELCEVIVKRFLQLNFEYQIYAFQEVREIHQLFSESIREGKFTHVIAAGGDGTVRETVALIAKNNTNVKLGILPVGTGNLLSKSLEIPLEITAALDTVITGKIKTIPVMKVNNTYATLVAGMGIDAEVMSSTESDLKQKYGPLAYILSSLKWMYGYKKSIYRLKIDHQKHVIRIADGVMVIQRNLYSKAFMPIALAPENDDTLLDICILKSKNWVENLLILQKLFIGDYQSNPKLLEHFQCRSIKINSIPNRKIQVDGDSIYNGVLHAEILSTKIAVMVPL